MLGRLLRLALLAPLACVPRSPSPGSSATLVEPSPAPQPKPAEPTRAEAPPPVASHDLYLAPWAGGLVRIAGHDASVQSIAPLQDATVSALAADARSRAYVAAGTTITILEDGVPILALPEATLGPITAIHAVSERAVWAVGMDGVAAFDGERWQTTSTDELGLPDPRDVTIDAAGRVWAMGTRGLVRRDGERFVPVPAGTDATVLDAFVELPGHALAVVHVGGLDGYDDERWTPVDLGFVPGASVPSGRAWGTVWADHGGGALTVASYLQVATRKDEWQRAYEVARAEHPLTTIEGLVVDDRGRSWVATDGGLLVIEPPAADFTWIGVGALPGVDDRVAHMLVLGRGPDVPALVDPGRGSVRGTLRRQGKPLAKARVELCAFPSLAAGKDRPCAGARHVQTTTTSADGTFALEGVVPGRHRLAVEAKPGRWRFFAVTECCRAARPGAPLDLGTLEATEGYEQGW